MPISSNNNNSLARVEFYGSLIRVARNRWAVAQDAMNKLPGLVDQLSKLTGDTALDFEITQINPVEFEIDADCTIVILLCAFAIEGYINDYAARNLPDSIVEDVDKLDTVSKWVIIPQLVTGKKFPMDQRSYQLLKNLIKDRNYIAHPKSSPHFVYDEKAKDIRVSDKMSKMYIFVSSLFDKANDAIKTLDELSLTMEELDPDEITSFFLNTMVGKRKMQFDDYGV